MKKKLMMSLQHDIPACIWCQNDVISTSMRRHHVVSTLIRPHFYAMCPLRWHLVETASAEKASSFLNEARSCKTFMNNSYKIIIILINSIVSIVSLFVYMQRILLKNQFELFMNISWRQSELHGSGV